MPGVTDSPGKKRYQAVAQILMADIRSKRVAPGGRLPSERALAQCHGVHRQTVRRALQDLREQGIVYSDRRGTYARCERDPSDGEPVGASGTSASFPGELCGSRPGSAATGRLSRARLPEDVASALGVAPGTRALVLRHRVLDAGTIVQSSLSYFADELLAEVPRLGDAALAASGGEHTDLGCLYGWMLAAGLHPVRRDSIAVLPPGRTADDAPGLEVGSPVLGVRRTVLDQYGRTLVLTDFRICASVGELVYESALA